MYPSRLSYSLAFTTAMLLAFPQGLCCAAHVGQAADANSDSKGREIHSSDGENGKTGQAPSRGRQRQIAAPRPAKTCCHPAHARIVRKSPRLRTTQDITVHVQEAETLTPTCPGSSPNSRSSDCCCHGAPPLVPPNAQVERPESESQAGEVANIKSDRFCSTEPEASSIGVTSPIPRHRLFCVWRC